MKDIALELIKSFLCGNKEEVETKVVVEELTIMCEEKFNISTTILGKKNGELAKSVEINIDDIHEFMSRNSSILQAFAEFKKAIAKYNTRKEINDENTN